MSRISIEAFHARLAGRSSEAGPLADSYRTLARRPDLARRAPASEWNVWTGQPARR